MKLQTTSTVAAAPRDLRRKAITLCRGVVAVDPLEAGLVEIDLVERRLGAVETVEVGDPALEPRVLGILQHPPFEASSCSHSRRWPNSPPMNSSFLPGCAHM